FNDILTNIQQDKIEILKQNPLNLQRFKVKLNEISVKAKHHLSYAENFSEDIEIGFDYVNYSLSQQRLNSMIVDLVEETIFCTNRIIQNAGINHSDIDTFLLVGGTSRMPLVRQRLETYNSSKIQSNVNPELAVSMGAAFSLSNSIDPKLSNAINLLISSILEYRNCVNCGRKIKMNNKFCQYCGKPNFSYRKM
ncbi:MAG: chaperone protein DnaK, partial [Bacteroidetes bacterium]|nr:chaperone protein DnaK [Bacteroidota bacterium]